MEETGTLFVSAHLSSKEPESPAGLPAAFLEVALVEVAKEAAAKQMRGEFDNEVCARLDRSITRGKRQIIAQQADKDAELPFSASTFERALRIKLY